MKLKKETGITGYMKSKNFMVFVVFLAVAVTMPNTFYVYCMFSDFTPFWKVFIGVLCAFIVAGFIMIYTLHKVYDVARWYAYFEVMISTYYYIRIISNNPDAVWYDLIPALGFTIMLPASVYKATTQLEKMDEEEPEQNLQVQPIKQDINKNIAPVKKKVAKKKPNQEIINKVLDNIKESAPVVAALKDLAPIEPITEEGDGFGVTINPNQMKNKIKWPDVDPSK
jgi:hypothetical protein